MKRKTMVGLVACALLVTASCTAFNIRKTATNMERETVEETVIGTPEISVNGESVNFSGRNLSQYVFESNGNVMVPAQAVAEKMEYTVHWNAGEQTITIEDDSWKVTAHIGEDLYSGVTKISGAVGATAPQSYGTAPVIADDTVYVPAKMFELMGYQCKANGQFIEFSNVHTMKDQDGNEYSNSTLIVTVSQAASEEELSALFDSLGMDALYKMDRFNMYAVHLRIPAATADELEYYIAELERNTDILTVNRDYVMQLDDSSQDMNMSVQ